MDDRRTADLTRLSIRLERVLRDAEVAGLSGESLRRLVHILKAQRISEQLSRIADEATAAAGGDESKGMALFVLRLLNEPDLFAEAAEAYLRSLIFSTETGQHIQRRNGRKTRLYTLINQLPDSQIDHVENLLEDILWMESDLSHLGEFEPYEWGPDGPPPGKPLRYVPGIGIVVDDEEDGKNG